MATHKMHHYVPDFLLRQWHTPPDEKLTQFTWVCEKVKFKLEVRRYKGKAVAKELHLNSTERHTENPDNSAEIHYFTSDVDNPAAIVHSVLSEKGLNSLDQNQREVWSRFLAAQMIRIPSGISEVRSLGKSLMLSAMENVCGEKMDDVTSANPMLDDFGIKAMPYAIEALKKRFQMAKWELVRYDKSSVDLIIGDSPLVVNGFLESNLFVALPIAPRLMFFSYTDEILWKKVHYYTKTKQTEMVKILNRDMVEQANKYVYATNSAHKPLIHKYLKIK